MIDRLLLCVLLVGQLVWSAVHASEEPPSPTAIEACQRDLVVSASPGMDIETLRQACVDQLRHEQTNAGEGAIAEDSSDTALERRVRFERATQFNPFVLTPYRPNYVLPLAYQDSPNLASTNGNGLSERLEVKFQFSFRIPVLHDVLGTGSDLSIAYTAKSFWQAYDASQSRPFRETNHEPEVFLSIPVNWSLFGSRLDRVLVGVNHQSNGQDLPESRSWNRVYTTLIWEVQDLMVSFQPWIRIPDPDKKSPDDPRGDDNPDIERYAGQFELVVAWRNDNDTYSAVWRNNARADNRGSLELGWSFPFSGRARGYVQVFTGYAESLIDYQDHHNRISVGILMTDWL